MNADQVAVVLVPGEEVILEGRPGVSGAGRLTMAKLSKTDQGTLLRARVCGHLATVRETLAVAPGITTVRGAVIRLGPAGTYGHRRRECLLAASLSRGALDGVAWDKADNDTIVEQVSSVLLVQPAGQAKRLAPLDLADEPGLKSMLDDGASSWTADANVWEVLALRSSKHQGGIMGSPSEIVERFMEAFPAGDAKELASFFTEDAVYHNIPLEAVHGRDAIEATLATFLSMVETVRFECLHLVADGDLVMTERVDHFISPERTVSLPVMGAFELKNGAIASWRDYFDMNQFTSQLGS